MAKKRDKPVEAQRPDENPRFSVHFHAEADSPEELHRKMGKAFGKGNPGNDETSKDRKRRGGSKARGKHRLIKVAMKKDAGKRG